MRPLITILVLSIVVISCNKNSGGGSATPPPATNFGIASWSVNNIPALSTYRDINISPSVRFSFPTKINRSSVDAALALKDASGSPVAYQVLMENGDSTVVLQPLNALGFLTKYVVSLNTNLKSVAGGSLNASADLNLYTTIDSSRKFPLISDDSLITLIQQQTFKYFWDFGHPVSGLARERNSSGETVTSGGSGFGIMTIIVAVNRSFITRGEALARMQKIVDFLKNKAQRFHGGFPHWLNGTSGVVIPFSIKDDGADLVETAYLMQGLLCARQYFNGSDVAETALRSDINTIWNGVEWNWFRKNNENVLYWHWSPNYNWDMNFPVRGWNEALITYVLAASSPNYFIPKIVYDNGWANNTTFLNGNTYYGYQLPLGPAYGGPLFFAHYSFLGINPMSLTDAYADYWKQNKNHTLINYTYCKTNPKGFFGYSNLCWGLTASDDIAGYLAHEPNNDDGVISPTAALSSFPYTPIESMNALKFLYYTLGDKLWGQYGFMDAFSIHDIWFSNSFLAIDQGPIIVMIENYRSGLLWNLFMSCPEVKTGMKNLGFQSPNL